MSVERFTRLRELVVELLSLPEQERARRLGQVDDAELRARAEALLLHDPGDDPLESIEAARPDTDVPERLGRYPVLRRLGTGGMGEIYSALDPELGREIAIKVLSERSRWTPGALAQLRTEARLLARVNHPSIATIHSLETDGERLLLTLEQIPGRSLAERLDEAPLPLDDVLEIGRQLASALEAAHAHSIVHRDVKPSNVMIAPDGRVKVLDFGIAELVDAHHEAARTHGFTAGTPGYMSPEQVQGQPTDHRTDIWALGCLLYECLAGRKAFDGETRERLHATLHTEPDLDALPDGIPPEIVTLVASCLRKTPDARPATMRDVRRQLDDVAEAQTFERMRTRIATQSAGRPAALPLYATRFFGRDTERRRLLERLAVDRAVTLTGLGGMGKTRLAVEVAREATGRFDDGIVYVALVDVSDPEQLAPAVAAALELREQPDCSPRDAVYDALSTRTALLLLDNCEHLRDAVADLVREILARCPGVRVLATSREPLGIDGERPVSLPPFPVPGANATGTLREDALVQLFVDRARAADPDFQLGDDRLDDVVAICRATEGHPLTVELIAAYAGVLTPAEIRSRLADGLDEIATATRPGDPRKRSLRRILELTYDGLSPRARSVFRATGIFRGGFTVDALEAVCEGSELPTWEVPDLLSEIIAASLVQRDPGTTSRSRYRLLEVVRQFAIDRARTECEESRLADRHLAYYQSLFRRQILTGPEQRTWIARFREEQENLRAAIAHHAANDDALERAVDLANRLCGPYVRTGRWREGRRTYDELITALDERLPGTSSSVRLRRSAAEIASIQGDLEQASRHLDEAMSIADALGDRALLVDIVAMQGSVEQQRGNLDEARTRFDRALELRAEHPNEWDRSGLLFNRGVTFALQGRLEEAEHDFRESLAIKRALGDDRGVSHALNGLGHVKSSMGELEEAHRLLDESLEIKRGLGDEPGMVNTLLTLGWAGLSRTEGTAHVDEALQQARRAYEEAYEIITRLDDVPNRARALDGLGWVAYLSGDVHAARDRFEAALRAVREVGNRAFEPIVLLSLGACAMEEGRAADAWSLGLEALDGLEAAGMDPTAEPLELLGRAAIALDRPESAARLLGASERMRETRERHTAPWKLREYRSAWDSLAEALSTEHLARARDAGRRSSFRELVSEIRRA
jgi:non-specific serine/threonine protein kinase